MSAVVKSAMTTMIVYAVLSMIPSVSPTVATTISSAPRALSVKPTASALRGSIRPARAPR